MIGNIDALGGADTESTLSKELLCVVPLCSELSKSVKKSVPILHVISECFRKMEQCMEAHHRMMVTCAYEAEVGAVQNFQASLVALMAKIQAGEVPGVLEAFAGKPFLVQLQRVIDVIERDIGKAKECAGADYDEAFVKTIMKMEAIAGGGAKGTHWCEGLGGGDLMTHFEKTLDKVPTDQISDCSMQLLADREQYALKRITCDKQDELLARAATALLSARVTHLECVILRTAKKSRKPVQRLETLLSQFDTGDLDGGRVAAKDVLRPPVLKFLQDAYSLLV